MDIQGSPKPLIIKGVSFYTECRISFNHLFIKTISECPFYESVSGVSRIEKDYQFLIDELNKGNFIGDEVQGFEGHLYKVRIPSSDQKKGKSGGFRVIYYTVIKDKIGPGSNQGNTFGNLSSSSP